MLIKIDGKWIDPAKVGIVEPYDGGEDNSLITMEVGNSVREIRVGREPNDVADDINDALEND